MGMHLREKKNCAKEKCYVRYKTHIYQYIIFFGVSGNFGLKYIDVIKLPRNPFQTL